MIVQTLESMPQVFIFSVPSTVFYARKYVSFLIVVIFSPSISSSVLILLSCRFVFYCCLVTKSGLTLCNPMDGSPPGSSVRGISRQECLAQARMLEWAASLLISKKVIFFNFQ